MKQYGNFGNTMESRDHFKNGASLKSQMSKGNQKTKKFQKVFSCCFFLFLTLLCINSCNKDENNTSDNTEILKDAIFYSGNDFQEGLVTFTNENNEEISLFAFKGFVVVYFQDNVNLETATQIITQLNGTVVERIPAINYYLVEVNENTESDFIKEIQKQQTEYISPYLILEPNSYYTAIIDDHRPNKVHGKNTLWVYNQCGSHSGQTFMSRVDVGGTENGKDYAKTNEALNFLITDNGFFTAKANLVNMSFIPSRKRYETDNSFYDAVKKRINEIIIRIEKIQKYRTDKDIVVTIAAGNDNMDIYNNVIKPLTTRELSSSGRNILKNNILIVGAIDKRARYLSPYSNTSSLDNAFAYVNISDLPDILNGEELAGTSFAAPRALCYISQIMEQKNLTAAQALKLAKDSIAANGGVFDLDKILSLTPVVSISNVKSDSATVTVSIKPADILSKYPSVVSQGEVGCTYGKDKTFPIGSWTTKKVPFNSTKSTYTFDLDKLTPGDTYYVYGWVKYGSTAKDYIDNGKANPDSLTTIGKGVLINGVRWATCNVGATPHTFTAKPEDYGGYYQWNRGTTDFMLFDDYFNSVYAKSDTWLPANDPSPAGYRVPTLAEIQSLTNTTYASYVWTTQNGVNGGKFTDRATGKSIFLPAAGCRIGYYDGTVSYGNSIGGYWSSTQVGSSGAYGLQFNSGGADWINWSNDHRSSGFCVRPVIK